METMIPRATTGMSGTDQGDMVVRGQTGNTQSILPMALWPATSAFNYRLPHAWNSSMSVAMVAGRNTKQKSGMAMIYSLMHVVITVEMAAWNRRAGRGANGANSGRGTDKEITINEDMRLLIAVTHITKDGGKGLDEWTGSPATTVLYNRAAINANWRTTSKLPSPSNTMVKVSMRGSGITAVQVPGTVRRLLRPGSPRNQREPLQADDEVKIIGIMPGINNQIPGLQATCSLVLQYPLRLIDPVYPESVAYGEHFTVQWTDEAFIYMESETLMLGERGILRKTFGVCETAQSLGARDVQLCLMLTPPSSRQDPIESLLSRQLTILLVSSLDIAVQVSSKYTHNRSSSYLLVTHANSPGTFIRQLSGLIQHELMIELDIYDISLRGSSTLPSRVNIMEH
ncbi:hypothetical protein JHW43_009472 [Diplocarpon mali]|nr:hypothetical protein JHW43_009472 [Diplocarpon mali]